MAMQIKGFIRNAAIKVRQGADGPEQYARLELHVEIPDTEAKRAFNELTDNQKTQLLISAVVEQPALPMGTAPKNDEKKLFGKDAAAGK